MEIDLIRKRLISRAHVLKAQIGLTDDDFEQLKKSTTGVPSLRLMDLAHLRAFVAAIERLQSSKELPAAARRLSDGQYRKIIKLGKYILRWTDQQIDAFIERETGKKNLKWLTAREAYNVTEALSSIIERSNSHAVKARYSDQSRRRKADSGQEENIPQLPKVRS